VTSSDPVAGKSLTVANLAVAMAQIGHSVVVVDADFRHPRLGHLFGFDPRSDGLSKALLEESADGRLHPVQLAGLQGLRILPSGELPPNPMEMVSSAQMQKLLRELAQQVDMVLIDSPPVLPVADAVVLAQAVDGVLLVLRAGKTRREAARRALERIRQVNANVVGVVLNDVRTHRGSDYYHQYYKYYGKRIEKWKRFGRRQKQRTD
jgi:capsular exopolysaccharide synthesis family protein